VRVRIVLIVCAGLVLLAGCGGSDSGRGDDTRSVVAAFYPLAFAAEQVGGGAVDVTNLTPPGAEPHDVELSARAVEGIRSADVVLYLGRGFQPAVERAVEGADGTTVDLLDGMTLAEGVGEEGEHGPDPHVWLDPVRFAALVERIGAVLDRPKKADDLAARLRRLDREFESGLASCKRHEIVTSHAAFGYLAKRYGLEQIAITGLSPEAEPTPQQLENVVAEVRRAGATTIFFEALVSPKLAETVARETGADTAKLDPIEGLTEEEIAGGGNYFSVMHANLASLRRALGCR
jgi:zinc transport system substrate-binding protein